MELKERDQQTFGGSLSDCCIETIKALALNNPMMLCQECKCTIKCFDDEVALSNYATFCQSRGRNFLVGSVNKYRVIIFRSYQPYNSH